MFPNGGHGHQPAPAPAPGPGQLPLGQGLGPNVGHHLGHTISPMGPPSSGNQLPGGEGELDVISYFIEYFNRVMVRFARSTGPRSGVRRGCGPGHDDPAHPHPGPLQLQPHRLLLLQLRLGLRLRRRLPAPAAVLAPVAHPARQLITRRPHLQMPAETKPGPRGPRYSPPGQPFPDLNAEGIHPSLSNLYCTRQMSEKVVFYDFPA